MPDARRGRSIRILQAFSEATRVRILIQLRAGELCVGDLVRALDVPQPSISRHLATLRGAGLVRLRGAGLRHYYRLAPPDHALQARLLGCLGRCLAGLAVRGADSAGPGTQRPCSAPIPVGPQQRTRVSLSA